jgi:hypothetical protein
MSLLACSASVAFSPAQANCLSLGEINSSQLVSFYVHFGFFIFCNYIFLSFIQVSCLMGYYLFKQYTTNSQFQHTTLKLPPPNHCPEYVRGARFRLSGAGVRSFPYRSVTRPGFVSLVVARASRLSAEIVRVFRASERNRRSCSMFGPHSMCHGPYTTTVRPRFTQILPTLALWSRWGGLIRDIIRKTLPVVNGVKFCAVIYTLSILPEA